MRPSISLSLESFERVSPFVLQVEAVCDHEGISEGGERDAAWDLVSGEGGGVRIERVSALEGRFEFRRPGRYVLRCLVTDGELEGGRDFLVEVGEEGIASYRRIEGLELSLEAYEARAIMENARGARCWELLFSGAKQADGRLLAIEFGESLPTSGTGRCL